VTMLAVPTGQSRKAGVGRRWALALLAACTLLLTWGLNGRAWAAAPKEPTPPKLVSITFSPSTVAVSGLDTVPVTVGLRLTDDSGVITGEANDACPDPLCDNPGVYLAPVGGGGRPPWHPLKLTSGTPRDGIWSTTFAVPSTWNGQWQVRELFAGDAHENLFVDPTTIGITSKLTVVGVHQPRLSMGFSPNPVVGHGSGKITVKGRAYFANTGKPIPGLSIWKGEDGQVRGGTVGDPCGMTIGPWAVTNAQGGYSIPADTLRVIHGAAKSMSGMFPRSACRREQRLVSGKDWVTTLSPKKRAAAHVSYNGVHEGRRHRARRACPGSRAA
jgi:hypothetical protein